MAEITFIVDPGADNILIDGVSVNAIDAFRDECLSSGAVSCGWDTLHTRLINHDVSRFWWFLTESDRRSIAEMVIRNVLFFNIKNRRIGTSNCGGGTGTWEDAVCTDDALIRYFKFTSTSVVTRDDIGIDESYWKHPITDNEHCYVPDNCLGLPGHTIQCAHFATGFFHAMCGIHVRQTTDDLNSWVIFQYTDIDIKPGDWQMPKGSTVRVYTPTEVGWMFYKGDLITSFYEV